MICRKLNTYVDVYKNTEADDSQGGATPTWSSVATIACHVQIARGTRALLMGQELGFYPYEITLRKQSTYSGVTITFNEDYVIYYDSKWLTLHSVIEDEDGYYNIFAYERR